MLLAACLKLVDRRPEVDPLTGAVDHDSRTAGPSDADQAALEWALRLGDRFSAGVVAVSTGSAVVEPMLRDALAAGAARAVRVDLPEDAPSEQVAAGLASALPAEVGIVVCGAWSTDRGSGSVPAYLAAHRRAAQALGLITFGDDSTASSLTAERRLDGGRRERLRVGVPAVVSVEGGMRLRRAGLDAVLAARATPIEVAVPPPLALSRATRLVHRGPFRPRSRALPAPAPTLSARERILALTGALVDRDPPRVVRLAPATAADELLAQLEAWGYR